MAGEDIEEIRTQAEYERLFRSAHVSRTRGDYEHAIVFIRRALELRPMDPEAREFAADMLLARGEMEKAAEEYKAIFEADKSRTSAEEKFARATVQIAEGKRQKDLLRQMIENPDAFRSSYQLPPRNPTVAAVLSGIPGLGHVYCGQTVKGIVLFLATSFCWLLFFALRPNVGGLGDPISRFVQNLNAAAVLFLCLAVSVHLYAFVDAAVTADRISKGLRDLAEPR